LLGIRDEKQPADVLNAERREAWRYLPIYERFRHERVGKANIMQMHLVEFGIEYINRAIKKISGVNEGAEPGLTDGQPFVDGAGYRNADDSGGRIDVRTPTGDYAILAGEDEYALTYLLILRYGKAAAGIEDDAGGNPIIRPIGGGILTTSGEVGLGTGEPSPR
jgi:hypothetical protein